MIHPLALVHPTATVFPTAQVWQGAYIREHAVLEAGVNIGGMTEIGCACLISEGSRIGYGCFLPASTYVGRRVFIGPRAVFCDDKHPVAGAAYTPHPPRIGDDASIGAGAVILPGVRIGRGAVIGAGAVVTHDVPDGAVVYGVAARQHTRPMTTEGVG